MTVIVLPALLYGFVHLLGRYFPAQLWGADQLSYYALPVALYWSLLTVLPVLAVARSDWLQLADQWLVRQLQPVLRRGAALWPRMALAGVSVLLAYVFRDRTHHLGDSDKWFSVLEHALLQAVPVTAIPAHHSRLDLPGFEFVNYQQALDLIIHFQIYRLGYNWWGWTAAEAYEWTSCLAAGVYFPVLWSLAGALELRLRERLTLFGFLAALGLSQLFFGYGESYTLVTLAMALYGLYGVRHLKGEISLAYPTACLLLACCCHLLALSLSPSWVYLVWRDRGRVGTTCRRVRVYIPLLLGGGAVGAYGFAKLYSGLHMPLWRADQEGMYAIVSWPHLANLANEILLLSPFGLVWGAVGLASRRPATPAIRFFGLGALGAGALISVHYISMGGRDWDLMAFPGLFYSLWGILWLAREPRREEYLRGVRWVVLPLMVLHSVLWIGINHHPVRALERGGNLLEYTPNQPLDYQYFVRALYHLNMRRDDPNRAASLLRQALSHVSPDDEGSGRRYRKYLGQALLEAGDYTRADAVFTRAFSGQDHPLALQSDMAFWTYWISAQIESGSERARAGEEAVAAALWQRAIANCHEIAALQPSAALYALLGQAQYFSGRYDEAAKALRRGVELASGAEERGAIYLHLARSLRQGGHRADAMAALKSALALDPNQPEVIHNLGNLYYAAGQFDRAEQSYRQAVNLDRGEPRYHLNLAESLRARGALAGAAQVLAAAVRLHPTRSALWQKLAEVERARTHREKAIEAYRTAIALEDAGAEPHMALVRLYLEGGASATALPLLMRILEKDLGGSDADTYIQVGIDLYSLHRVAEAARAYRRALAIDEDNQVAWINLGWCSYVQGDLAAAIAAYERVLAGGSSPQAQFNLGLAYLAGDAIAAARSTYAQGIAQYGAAEARRIGAVDDLRALVARGAPAAAGEILRQYWEE